MKAKILFIGLALLGFCNVNGQVFFNFNTPAPTNNTTSYSIDSVRQGNSKGFTAIRTTANPSNTYTGASGSYNAAIAADTGGFLLSQTSYFEVVLIPAGSSSVVISGVSFGSFSAANGPQAFSVRTSDDNFTNDLAVGSLMPNSSWAFTGIQNLNLVGVSGVPITVRIYGFNGVGSVASGAANWRIDDLSFYTTATPLPLTLTAFNANVVDGKVDITFKTANEKNVSNIIVEKSTDSRNFISLKNFEPENGTSNEYSAVDNINATTTYYRLKVIENNETFSYSNTLKVNGTTTTKPVVSVYPNPTQDNLNVSYTSSDTRIPYLIYTTSGTKVAESSFAANTTSSMIDVSTLPTGNYVLYISNGLQKTSTVFVRK